MASTHLSSPLFTVTGIHAHTFDAYVQGLWATPQVTEGPLIHVSIASRGERFAARVYTVR